MAGMTNRTLVHVLWNRSRMYVVIRSSIFTSPTKHPHQPKPPSDISPCWGQRGAICVQYESNTFLVWKSDLILIKIVSLNMNNEHEHAIQKRIYLQNPTADTYVCTFTLSWQICSNKWYLVLTALKSSKSLSSLSDVIPIPMPIPPIRGTPPPADCILMFSNQSHQNIPQCCFVFLWWLHWKKQRNSTRKTASN